MHYNFKKNKYFKPRQFSNSTPTTKLTSSNLQATPNQKSYVPNKNCYLCKTVEHELINCKKFEKLPVSQRYTAVVRSGSCYHCLRRGHRVVQCRTNPRVLCGVNGCKLYEHPMIHADKTTGEIHLMEWSTPAHGDLPEIESDNEQGSSNHCSKTLQMRDVPDPNHFINMTHFQTNMSSMKVAAQNAISIQTVVCSISSRVNKVGRRIVSAHIFDHFRSNFISAPHARLFYLV